MVFVIAGYDDERHSGRDGGQVHLLRGNFQVVHTRPEA